MVTGNEIVIALSGANLLAMTGMIFTVGIAWGRMTEKLASIAEKLELLPDHEKRIQELKIDLQELKSDLAVHVAGSDRRKSAR